jgi:hypothetical protein
MKYFFSLSFLFFSLLGMSQFESLQEIRLSILNPPTRGGSLGDVDGDGLQDIVLSPNVAAFPGLQFLVLRKGILEPPYFSQSAELLATQFFEIILEDFDGDGDNDAFLYRFSGGTTQTVGAMFMKFNDGEGNFGPFVPLPNEGGAGARRAFTSDFDSDGDIDIVYSVVNSDSVDFQNGLVWLENDGTGIFEAHILSEDGSYAVAPIDLDNDGDLDLVVSRLFADEFIFFENIANEEFVFWTSQPSIEFPSEISVGDFNEDGFDDFVSAATDVTRFIAYYENNNTDPPSFTETLVNDFNNRPSTNMLTPDFNNDGHLDIVWSSLNAQNVGWFEGDGEGNFTDRGILMTIGESRTRRIILADLNDDDFPDFINTSNTANFSGVALNESGEDLNPVPFGFGAEFDDPFMGTAFQADGDFEEEILLLNRGNGIFFVVDDLLLTNSSFELVDSENYTQLIWGGSVDADNDGDGDIVVSTDQGLFLFERTPETYLESQLTSGLPYDYFELYDVNGDQIEDLIALNSSTSTIEVLFSDGGGGYGAPVLVTDQTENAAKFALLEGNEGNPSGILFPQNISDQLVFIPFLGGEDFGNPEAISPNPYEINLIETGDIDGDMHPDIVVADNGSLWYLTNSGNNQFGQFTSVGQVSEARQITVEDYSANGFDDILLLRDEGDGNIDNLLLFENATDGSFFVKQSYSKGGISSYITGRFDEDYFLDLSFDVFANRDLIRLALNGYPNTEGFLVQSPAENSFFTESVRAFPNPVQTSFRLTNPSAIPDDRIDMAVFDLQGRRVANYTQLHKSQAIDATGLTPGFYRLVITAAESNKRYHLGITKK